MRNRCYAAGNSGRPVKEVTVGDTTLYDLTAAK